MIEARSQTSSLFHNQRIQILTTPRQLNRLTRGSPIVALYGRILMKNFLVSIFAISLGDVNRVSRSSRTAGTGGSSRIRRWSALRLDLHAGPSSERGRRPQGRRLRLQRQWRHGEHCRQHSRSRWQQFSRCHHSRFFAFKNLPGRGRRGDSYPGARAYEGRRLGHANDESGRHYSRGIFGQSHFRPADRCRRELPVQRKPAKSVQPVAEITNRPAGGLSQAARRGSNTDRRARSRRKL